MTHDFKAAAGELFLYIQSYFENKSNLSYKTVLDAQEALRIMAEVQEGRIVLMPRKKTKGMDEAVLRNAFIHHDGSILQYEWWAEVLAAAPDVIGKEGAE